MAPRPRLLLGWQPLHSGCSLSSFPLPDPAPPLPPSPPPHSTPARASRAAETRPRSPSAGIGGLGGQWAGRTAPIGGTKGAEPEGAWPGGAIGGASVRGAGRAEAEMLRAPRRNGFGQGSGRRDETRDWLDVSPGVGTRMPKVASQGRVDRVGPAADRKPLGAVSNSTGRMEGK